MSSEADPAELPLLLLAGFRELIDELHTRLAAEGHPDVRPIHGFALQAIGWDGAGASELGRRLGVTKQAAAKTGQALERLGYVERSPDPADARSRRFVLTERGEECLRLSGAILSALRSEWSERLGAKRLDDLVGGLRELTAGRSARLDSPGWMGSGR